MVRKKLVCSEAKEAANKLKTIRKRLHVTQKSLEESTGIEQAVLSRIEKGTSEPQISTLVNIADALGYDLIIKFVKKKTK